jgi:hypothetical protein
MTEITRRMFCGGAAALTVAHGQASKDVAVHRFQTEDLEIEMKIQFRDGYASQGFWFREHTLGRSFCVSVMGEENRDCMTNFRGSLAMAQYRVRPRSKRIPVPNLRELVRTIDRDPRLLSRPPFERTIKLEKGLASDLQAFGYEAAPGEKPIPEKHGPWYLHRQDLFLEPQPAPFLVLYWKHALTSIRVLDIIPGEQTRIVKK